MGHFVRLVDAGKGAAGVAGNASWEQAQGAGQFSRLLFDLPAGEGLTNGTYSHPHRRHVV